MLVSLVRNWILKFSCFLFSSIPEIVFWHIPSTAYVGAGPGANQPMNAPCVGSINDENVAPQEAEQGIMKSLTNRSSVKVRNSTSHFTSLALSPVNWFFCAQYDTCEQDCHCYGCKMSAMQYIEDDPKHQYQNNFTYGPYAVTFLNQRPIYEWYMTRLVEKNGH